MDRLKSGLLKLTISLTIFTVVLANFDFSAKEETVKDISIGVITYKDNAVIKIYATGPFVTIFSRAQMIAYRLNEYLEKYEDIDKIRLSYPEGIYTASISGRNLFSVYKEDAKQNNLKVEALMADWINNLKLAMMPIEEKKEEVITSGIDSNKIIETKEQENVKEFEEIKDIIESVAIITSDLSETKALKDIFLEDIENRLDAIENKMFQISKRGKGTGWLWIFTIFNLGAVLYLIFFTQKAKKQLGNFEEIEKVGRVEELENSVSMLLKELKEVSGEATDKVVSSIKKQDDVAEIEKQEERLEEKDELIFPEEDQQVIVPEVEDKEVLAEEQLKGEEEIIEQPKQEEEKTNDDNQEDDIADSLEEALEADKNESEIIEEKDILELEKETEEIIQDNNDDVLDAEQEGEQKTDAVKLAEELEGASKEMGAEEEKSVNANSNLSNVGMAELFKILSKLDKDIREEVKAVVNNKMLNKNEKIIKMKAFEMDHELIAKVLGIGKEEVNLVIQLNELENG